MPPTLPRILTPADAARRGVTRSRWRTEIRRGRWQAVAPGVVVTHAAPLTRADWADIGVALIGVRAAVTGWDALQVRGLAGRLPPPPRVVVLTREGRSRTLGPLLVRRTDRPYAIDLADSDQRGRSRLPLVATSRAVADTALQCRLVDDVRAIVARAVQRGRCSVAELRTELESGPRNGSAFLRTALDEVGAGARSVAEAHALRELRRSRLAGFELNVPLVDLDGRVVFVADVLWRSLRAVLEIDSVEYHLDREDWHRTMRRHTALSACGLSVVHFPPSAIRLPGWVDDVGRWLDGRAVELGVARLGTCDTSAAPDVTGPMVLPGLSLR